MLKKVELQIAIPAVLIIGFIGFNLIVFPEISKELITSLQQIVLDKVGFVFMWYGIFAFAFVLGVSFSKYGKVKLGKEGEEPEYSNFSWVAMLFCAGIGASIIYWGVIEWSYYYQELPYGSVEGSFQAVELAATYGIFHWGPAAWAIYAVSAASVGYLYHVRKVPVFRFSESLRPILGKWIDGPIGKGIDVFFIIGLLGGAGTSLGLGTPLATEGIGRVFDIEVTSGMELIILMVITSLFAYSAYSGLKKGIKYLSDINVFLTVLLLLFVFIIGDHYFMIDMGTTSLGLLIDRFPIMMTWMDPVGKSGFPQTWTVFYWAWWVAYAPFMGMFIAKISKGRTVKNMLLGSIFFGSTGCAIFFIVLGNYGLSLHLNGIMDVVATLNASGGAYTIISIFETLPMSNVIILLVTVVSIVFMATTFDSASYVMAATASKRVTDNEEPARPLRLFFAFMLAVLPISFILLGSELRMLQTLAIATAFPVTFISVLSGVSYFKMVEEDQKVIVKTETEKAKVVIGENIQLKHAVEQESVV